jgi:UDP-GlcNAc:undecaprenyl-phosphate GlcNAc-1-phosphate transferase
LDDKYDLSPRKQILFPVLASLIVILFGIGPREITSPLGGIIKLDYFSFDFFSLNTIFVLSAILVFVWLMLIMYSIKFFDGVDGLATTIVFIGSLVLFFLSLQEKWFDTDIAFLAIIFAGSSLGFLVWNFNPAKIFLGEGGSIFLGFFLGVLAIISGAKIATTMLVMAIPIIDVLRVLIIRIKNKKPIYVGDKEHIHHRLLEKKYSQKQVVYILASISFLFAISAFYLQTTARILIFLFLVFLMLITVFLSGLKKI